VLYGTTQDLKQFEFAKLNELPVIEDMYQVMYNEIKILVSLKYVLIIKNAAKKISLL
jgi:hypothetical protein